MIVALANQIPHSMCAHHDFDRGITLASVDRGNELLGESGCALADEHLKSLPALDLTALTKAIDVLRQKPPKAPTRP